MRNAIVNLLGCCPPQFVDDHRFQQDTSLTHDPGGKTCSPDKAADEFKI
jgi:hypothetical protein